MTRHQRFINAILPIVALWIPALALAFAFDAQWPHRPRGWYLYSMYAIAITCCLMMAWTVLSAERDALGIALGAFFFTLANVFIFLHVVSRLWPAFFQEHTTVRFWWQMAIQTALAVTGIATLYLLRREALRRLAEREGEHA